MNYFEFAEKYWLWISLAQFTAIQTIIIMDFIKYKKRWFEETFKYKVNSKRDNSIIASSVNMFMATMSPVTFPIILGITIIIYSSISIMNIVDKLTNRKEN